jgi:hypothetical protein
MVPRWLPRFPRYPHRQGQWSWEGIRASREWKTLLWVIVALLAMYFLEEWFQEREVFEETGWRKQAVLVAIGATLIISDGVIELVRRRRPARNHPSI